MLSHDLNTDQLRSVDKQWLKSCGVTTAGEYGETDLGFRGGQIWRNKDYLELVLVLGNDYWLFVSAQWNPGGMTWCNKKIGDKYTDQLKESDLIEYLKDGWMVAGTAYEKYMEP